MRTRHGLASISPRLFPLPFTSGCRNRSRLNPKKLAHLVDRHIARSTRIASIFERVEHLHHAVGLANDVAGRTRLQRRYTSRGAPESPSCDGAQVRSPYEEASKTAIAARQGSGKPRERQRRPVRSPSPGTAHRASERPIGSPKPQRRTKMAVSRARTHLESLPLAERIATYLRSRMRLRDVPFPTCSSCQFPCTNRAAFPSGGVLVANSRLA
jgi:hypothetical protein